MNTKRISVVLTILVALALLTGPGLSAPQFNLFTPLVSAPDWNHVMYPPPPYPPPGDTSTPAPTQTEAPLPTPVPTSTAGPRPTDAPPYEIYNIWMRDSETGEFNGVVQGGRTLDFGADGDLFIDPWLAMLNWRVVGPCGGGLDYDFPPTGIGSMFTQSFIPSDCPGVYTYTFTISSEQYPAASASMTFIVE